MRKKIVYFIALIIFFLGAIIFINTNFNNSDSLNNKKTENKKINLSLNLKKYKDLYRNLGYDEFDNTLITIYDEKIIDKITTIISSVNYTQENIFNFQVNYPDKVFSVQYSLNDETIYVKYFFIDNKSNGLFVHDYELDNKYGYLNLEDKNKLFNLFKKAKAN